MTKITLGKEIIGASLLGNSHAGYPFTRKRVEDNTTWVGLAEMNPDGNGLTLSLFDMTQTHPVLLAKVEQAGAMETRCDVIEFGIDPQGQLTKLRLGYDNGNEPDARKIADAIKSFNPDLSTSEIPADQIKDVNLGLIRNALGKRTWFEFDSEVI
jgi:hypothetical protein